MQDLLWYIGEIKSQGVFYSSLPETYKHSHVNARDNAAVAVFEITQQQPIRFRQYNRPCKTQELTMSTDQEGLPRAAEVEQALERSIERQVMQRTWGRIQALEVKVSQNLVVVLGCAPSYYIEQLALQGFLEVIEPAGAMRIELNIQVGNCPKSARAAL
jgi:hypothetical protein